MNKLKILSCNIRVDVQADDEAGNGWDARKDFCLEVMLSHDADIICTQECRNAHFLYLKDGLTQFESFGLANPDTLFHPTNAIFFAKDRFESISSGGFWLSEKPHIAGSVSWDSARPRFVNYVELMERGGGRGFRIWNSHFDHIGQVAREKQGQVIVEASNALPDDTPQFFTADCNADASDPAIRNLLSGGWLDTFTAVHGPDDPGFTYHAFLGPDFARKWPDKTTGKIDFILCRGPVKVLNAEIIRDSRNGRYPSDHYFISAEVEIDPGS